MKRLKHMAAGFTLIELLIVLAVIAALLAIVTPVALNAVAQAKATQVASNLRNIRAAVESYVMIEKATPTNINDLASKGYLTQTSELDKYVVNVPQPTEGATVVNVTITYNGSVDTSKLFSILPDATVTDGNVTYSFKIPIWW